MNNNVTATEHLFALKQMNSSLKISLVSIERLNEEVLKKNQIKPIDTTVIKESIQKTTKTIDVLQKFHKGEISLEELIDYRDNFVKTL